MVPSAHPWVYQGNGFSAGRPAPSSSRELEAGRQGAHQIAGKSLHHPRSRPVKPERSAHSKWELVPKMLLDRDGDAANTGTGFGKPAKDLSINFVPVPYPDYRPAVIEMKRKSSNYGAWSMRRQSLTSTWKFYSANRPSHSASWLSTEFPQRKWPACGFCGLANPSRSTARRAWNSS